MSRDQHSHFAGRTFLRALRAARPQAPLCAECGVEMVPGASHGNVSTYDPTAPQGQRIGSRPCSAVR